MTLLSQQLWSKRQTLPQKPSQIQTDDDSIQTLTPNTPNETPQFPIQSETALLQNVKQIPKPSAQQKTPTFEQFEALLTRHFEKRLTAIQEKFESYLEKSVKQLQI